MNYYLPTEHAGLCFAVPLQGDFTLRFEQPAAMKDSLTVIYGGEPFNPAVAARHAAGGSAADQQATDQRATARPPDEKEWVEYRLVVSDGTLTMFVDDKQVACTKIEAPRRAPARRKRATKRRSSRVEVRPKKTLTFKQIVAKVRKQSHHQADRIPEQLGRTY